MAFEQLVVKDLKNLPEGHPAWYMEGVIKRDLLPKKVAHDAEHDAMLAHWGLPTDVDYDEVLSTRNGNYDRMWHIALHLRYWKEKGLNSNVVEEFESKFPLVNLLEIPLPKV